MKLTTLRHSFIVSVTNKPFYIQTPTSLFLGELFMDIHQTPHEKECLIRDKVKFLFCATDEELKGYDGIIQVDEKLEQKIIKKMIRLKCNYLAVNFICQLGSKEKK